MQRDAVEVCKSGGHDNADRLRELGVELDFHVHEIRARVFDELVFRFMIDLFTGQDEANMAVEYPV